MPSKTKVGGSYPAVTIHFTPVEKIESGEMMSVYLPGLTYHCRPGYERLHDLLFGDMTDGRPAGGGWKDQGKVLVTGMGGLGGGVVAAAAEVTEAPEPKKGSRRKKVEPAADPSEPVKEA